MRTCWPCLSQCSAFLPLTTSCFVPQSIYDVGTYDLAAVFWSRPISYVFLRIGVLRLNTHFCVCRCCRSPGRWRPMAKEVLTSRRDNGHAIRF